MTYLDELGRELKAVGIQGRLRNRILAEAADHLADSDPEREARPAPLASAAWPSRSRRNISRT